MIKSSIPTPKTFPLLGNLKNINPKAFSQSLFEIAKDFEEGRIYKLILPNNDMVIVGSQELVHEVSDPSRFGKNTKLFKEIQGLLGDGLVTAETESLAWGKAHRLLMPAFGPVAIRNLFPQMLDIAEQMMLKFERMGAEHSFDVSEEMTKLTLDTIALCSFNYRFNSFYSEELHPFVESMVDSLSEMGKRAVRFPLQTKLMVKTNQKYFADIDYMHTVGAEIVRNRKKDPKKDKYNDLLNIMLNGVDPISGERLSDDNIKNQMITFLIAGHETTSGLLTFAIYELLNNPNKLKKAQEEVQRILGNNQPTIDHLPQLTYIDQVLKETLRLHPIAPMYTIAALEDTVIGGKYLVKKDENVTVLIGWLHRDKAVWGEDVEAFKPERFAIENAEQLPENCFKPFGNGKRACIGRFFAMQEAVLALAMLLQRFDLKKDNPNYNLKIKEAITIKPDNFRIRVERKEEVAIVAPSLNPSETIANNKTKQVINKNGKPLLILFGSNTGLSEGFAHKIYQEATEYGYQPTLGAMDDYVNRLDKDIPVVIVTASYEGKPPRNAVKFMDWLENGNVSSLAGIQYAVLGCGHKDWLKTYQAIPIKVDQLLSKWGGKALIERGALNGATNVYGDFDKWQDQFWEKMPKGKTEKQGFSVVVSNNRLETLEQKVLRQGVIIENKELVDMTHPLGRSKRHIEIELPKDMPYQSGDYLSILPSNPKENIERIFQRLGYTIDTQITIQAADAQLFHLPVGYPVALFDIFTNYVELGQPATQKQVELLASYCPCPPEKNALIKLTDESIYTEEVLHKRVSVLDLLECYASIDIPLEQLLKILPPLKPRLYSIASSPYWDDQKVALTVAVVDAPAWSGQGQYKGVASNYLAHLPVGGQVQIDTQPATSAFHLPTDLSVPLIMIAAGSGIAPFRGFVQERSIQKQKGNSVGEIVLFFGCDHPEVDALYMDEFCQWEQEEVVQVFRAYSALEEGDIKFVQHKLWAERKRVYELLQKGAKVFVCGDGKYMAPAVQKTFIDIYKACAKVSREEAKVWLDGIQKEGLRYATDIFI
ncbi:bifunctional cytochrome P450/NADPH--P450 reductase [Aureispira anguillae]|uniref:Bifunctional cytochrome P450/NADPH--P450 reductase n=1 Tax=Aureispira anguillae TaxID=2864201 RepID=A0A915VK05_9BACT|nr:cytochrome P450 [Aureispira anguillae]BDS09401.1 cytochrome P450 [Aureispira anguillae]